MQVFFNSALFSVIILYYCVFEIQIAIDRFADVAGYG